VNQVLPCLIISYRRLEGVQRLIQSLNEMASTTIYLAIDGPSNTQDLELQNEIENWASGFCKIHGIELHCLRRSENLGVGVSIIDALDWFFSNVSFGVVLEDDLEISEDFLNFVSYCGERYQHINDLWMISGDQFFPNDSVPNQISVANYPLVWGWATWSNRWPEMRTSLLQGKHFSPLYIFSPVKSFWWAGSKRVLSGAVDTWDIPLAFEMVRKKKMTFSPPVNLVKNVGHDSAASHTKSEQFPLNMGIQRGLIDFPNLRYIQSAPETKKQNRLLQRDVFGIRAKHIFSPLKFLMSLPTKKTRNTLKSRLQEVHH